MLPLPPAARDRSPLWKDFTKPGFERPFMVNNKLINLQYYILDNYLFNTPNIQKLLFYNL